MANSQVAKLRSWAFIPARGGSKSIPLKNLAILGGRPLMDYCVEAAKASGVFERILCSTDHPDIALRACHLGIEHDMRPTALGGDAISTKVVIQEFLTRCEGPLPDLLFIVEPTSPFLRPKDITALQSRMEQCPDAVSGLTVAQPPHTHHAWNQRQMTNGTVRFIFEERKQVFAKQHKPTLFIFGNVIACRVSSLLLGADVFAEPTAAVEIERPYDMNIDDPDDLVMAKALLAAEAVKLPHISAA